MPNSQNHDFHWYRLDNTAKVYPVVSNEKVSHVFRITAVCADPVAPEVLRQAAAGCRARFPSFYVKLRRGLFWYYYETNDKPPVIRPESSYMCGPVEPHRNNGYFFSFFYYGNRITLEIFHGITDGKGALEFFKTVLMRYFVLAGFPADSGGIVLSTDDAPSPEETEDSYLANYRPGPLAKARPKPAYHRTGTRFPQGGLGAVSGRTATEELAAIARGHGATISQLITAAYVQAILRTGNSRDLARRPVAIAVPIDMRRFFGSKTLRNFFLIFRTLTFSRSGEPEFGEILADIREQFKRELEPSKLQNTLNINVSHEKHAAANFFPLALKWLIIRGVHAAGGRIATTATMSNVGVIELPEPMRALVRGFEIHSSVSDRLTHNLVVFTYDGITTLSFSRCVSETDLERAFFRSLADLGIRTAVWSNRWEDHVR